MDEMIINGVRYVTEDRKKPCAVWHSAADVFDIANSFEEFLVMRDEVDAQSKFKRLPGYEPLKQDPCGHRGFIPGDFTPQSVKMNYDWMDKAEEKPVDIMAVTRRMCK